VCRPGHRLHAERERERSGERCRNGTISGVSTSVASVGAEMSGFVPLQKRPPNGADFRNLQRKRHSGVGVETAGARLRGERDADRRGHLLGRRSGSATRLLFVAGPAVGKQLAIAASWQRRTPTTGRAVRCRTSSLSVHSSLVKLPLLRAFPGPWMASTTLAVFPFELGERSRLLRRADSCGEGRSSDRDAVMPRHRQHGCAG
jgi:hypothetical protein